MGVRYIWLKKIGGIDMKTSHKGMRIDNTNWAVFLKYRHSTLDSFITPGSSVAI
jgi:hypothetical protein